MAVEVVYYFSIEEEVSTSHLSIIMTMVNIASFISTSGGIYLEIKVDRLLSTFFYAVLIISGYVFYFL